MSTYKDRYGNTHGAQVLTSTVTATWSNYLNALNKITNPVVRIVQLGLVDEGVYIPPQEVGILGEDALRNLRKAIDTALGEDNG